MKTVKEIKEDLNKFKDSDLCYAYEGEVSGIIVNRGEEQGVIFCGEFDGPEKETEIISLEDKIWLV